MPCGGRCRPRPAWRFFLFPDFPRQRQVAGGDPEDVDDAHERIVHAGLHPQRRRRAVEAGRAHLADVVERHAHFQRPPLKTGL